MIKKYIIIILTTILFIELILQLFLPKSFRIRENDIVLPTNQVYKIKNITNNTLDNEIIHTRNSIGLRGSDLDTLSKIRIFTVGGSTTHCMYLSDNQEWTKILSDSLKLLNKYIWINNAGFSGQSTFGHLLLTKDYLIKFKPKYIIYYVGINDLLRTESSYKDNEFILSNWNLKRYFYWSKFIFLLENIYTTKLLKYSFINTDEKKIYFSTLDDMKTLEDPIDSNIIYQYLEDYKSRINKIIDVCFTNNVTPIFLTQSSLFTCGYDSSNTINLGNKSIDGKASVCSAYHYLNAYNNKLLELCEQRDVYCIDMAKYMQKDTSFFYDFVHFTPKGSQVFSNILYQRLRLIPLN